MSQNNPSPHAYRVRDALKDEYFCLNNIYLSAEGFLFFIVTQDCYIAKMDELLPDGSPRYVVERGTGQLDMDKRHIFQGDKVLHHGEEYEIIWLRGGFALYHKFKEGNSSVVFLESVIFFKDEDDDIRIIGNVHDKEQRRVRMMKTGKPNQPKQCEGCKYLAYFYPRWICIKGEGHSTQIDKDKPKMCKAREAPHV